MNISTRKQAEDALRENREILRLFIEYSPAAVAMFDTDMRYITASRRWLDDHALQGDVTGRSHYELFPDLPESWKAIHRQVLAGQAPATSEDQFERADGTIQWLRREVRPWRNPAGEQGGILIFSEDITEAKRADQQLKAINETLEHRVLEQTADLRATQRRLEHLLTSATGAIYSARPTGELGAMYLSPNVRQMTGYEPRQFVDDDDFWVSRIHADDLKRVIDTSVRAAQTGERMVSEYRFRCADGSYRWMRDEAQPIRDETGNVVEFVGYWTDITERKRTEAQISAYRAEMEQAQQRLVVSHTIGAIAHELNQPLSAVTTYSEAALRLIRAGNARHDELVAMLEKSAAQAHRAGQTMRELLSVLHAREAVSGPIDLAQTVREAIAAFALDGEPAHKFALNTPPKLPKAQAIPLYVQKILLNLFRNAAEAMREPRDLLQNAPNDGDIRIDINLTEDGHFLRVSVRDAGPGIPSAIAEKILQPFYTTKALGAGMGLAICRTLTETQGGRLWLDAAHNGPGACFHFTLPVSP